MTTKTLRIAAGSAIGLVATSMLIAQETRPNAAMLRYPDVSATDICFVYANDVWLVPKTGGVASPLASPVGAELFPRFSPDGRTLGFVANYDGNRDLYTVPIAGGVPSRVTHHPAGETLADWGPDGRLIFLTNGFAGLQRQSQLWSVDSMGGLPQKLPVPYAGFGSVSPDGVWLAYTPHSTDTRTWKRYRGGMATDVWLFNLRDNSSRRVTTWEGTDTLPMWVPASPGTPGQAPSVLYYLSDSGPEHRLNIWSFDLKTGKQEQITTHRENDVRWPSIGPGSDGKGEIVFQLGSELRLLNLGTRRDVAVDVTIPGARPTLRPRTVDAGRLITSGTISPSGKRVALEARGDIWSTPAKEGVVRNLTRTDGAFERSPAWSPDGKWIAYFSDEQGEYDLYIRPADSKPPAPKDDASKAEKDSAKDAPKKAGEADAGAAAPAAKAQADDAPVHIALAKAKKLTNLGPGFRYNPGWSPDSKLIAFTDNTGALFVLTVETGETKQVDKEPGGGPMAFNWSHDSNWITYVRTDEASRNACIWVYNLAKGESTRLTSPMFNSGGSTFDRKGDFLYFRSNRSVNSPRYSDIDETFIYANTELLYMVPLRADVKNPFAVRSDEEEVKPAKADDKDAKKGDSAEKKPGEDEKKPEGGNGAAVADDSVSGTWSGTATGQGDTIPPGGLPFTLKLKLEEGGRVTGTVVSAMGAGEITEGSFDKATGALTLTIAVGDGAAVIKGTIKNGELTGEWTAGDARGALSARRSAPNGKDDSKSAPQGDKAKEDKPKELVIDFADFERRAVQLPVAPGSFGGLSVTHDHKLLYVRSGSRAGGGEGPSIKIFDPTEDSPEEKAVTAGGGYELSADGKKLLVMMGGSVKVCDASAGGGKATNPPTSGMLTQIDPRAEWRQIFDDAWRIQRDFFYEPTMHGVDWAKMREHYGRMIDDCANREDVAWILAELISELNIGHAYVTSPGDVENAPNISVGLLGCDFELATVEGVSAYRISAIHEGGAWDEDARGPLSQPGVNVKVGDYLLAVNGEPVDTSRDPWAAFIGTADRPTTVTVGPNPVIDAQARDLVVKPIGSEAGLRFRAWIERNRKYVEEKSGGAVGYIYVPNTGVDGQNELFRQFQGQMGRAALIIDDRWNGGGQIPTRFIELLNRPRTNYWARRDALDWPWPPTSHQGPKCMLINGLAGSGGDMFPWLFRFNGLGKLIGTRTWGGLVGISGNPGLIDGGYVSVPTFGFYEKDGTWGVEGHGVDADIEVIDDPALMVNGGDPQLDKAIELMLEEIKQRPYVAPSRPASPDRSGMGIKPEDK